MTIPVEPSRPVSEHGSADDDAIPPSIDVTDMIEHQQTDMRSSSTSRGRPKQRPPDHLDTAMELDPTDNSPFSIATSSSIPSSSRSSLRGPHPPTRGRTASLSFSNPKLAEPKVDHSTASGEGAAVYHEEEQVRQHDHPGGHTLRNFVGGIFRRKSHADQKSHADPISHTPLAEGTKYHLTPSVPIHRHRPPPHVSHAVESNARPLPSHPETPSSPMRSPTHARSPGIAKPVTPRVRTRTERSVDSLNGNRVALGPVGGQFGVSGISDREERRARLE